MEKKYLVSQILIGKNINLMNISLLLLRCTIGLILFVVGAGKVLGWFGGMGINKTLQIFTSNMHIPAYLAYISCYTEFLGGLFLIIGLFTRPVAFLVTINMIVATIFMWSSGFPSGGAAYPFSLTIISAAILLSGPLNFSLDNLFFQYDGIGNKAYRNGN